MSQPTTAQLAGCIGRKVLLIHGQMRFTVEILDAKIAYGKVRVQVAPVSGMGMQWVEFGGLEPLQQWLGESVRTSPQPAPQRGIVATITHQVTRRF